LSARLHILVLNQISANGLKRLPAERYRGGQGHGRARRGRLLRSADMHAMDIPASVQAIGRAGAGTNNIPVPR
jgi:D-3-phosphoglycerate dehydrogenase / 2-oxoglutarate reductase